MPALNSAQLARMLEFQSDICALEEADFENSNFTQWFKDYEKYVWYGPDSEFGGQRPGHKPPL